MDTFEKTVAGHNVKFIPYVEGNETKHTVEIGDKTFTMVIVEERFKIVNPDSLPAWITDLEDDLSDAIFAKDM